MNVLNPQPKSYGLPPLRFRLKAFLKFNQDFSEALAELEARHPQRREFTLSDRNHSLLKRRPR